NSQRRKRSRKLAGRWFGPIERRLDTVRSVCHIAQKRLIACFQGQHGTDPDKRHVSTIAFWLVF
uniref:Uncharacterized protein n=1 Tax=Strix occidentalis caurina TaxID=311401 RepID=A0A8D0KZT3_STROC